MLDLTSNELEPEQGASGVAAALEGSGHGFPLRRLAMRKANIHDEGAASLALAIRRAASAAAAAAEVAGGRPGGAAPAGAYTVSRHSST
jgi:hypothetical protein